MTNLKISVGNFPYKPGFNPYQRLITDAIENAEINVVRIPPRKWFPLQQAAAVSCDLLHLDWPHDFYSGRNFLTQQLKQWMYLRGLKHLSNKPLVWTAHNLVSHDSKSPVREHRMIQKLINRCQGIVVLSEASRQMLLEHYSVPNLTQVKRIHHGHYIDCYPNTSNLENSREKLQLGQEKFIFLCVGAIKPYKGHTELINAFCKAASSDDVLVIAGCGSKILIDKLKRQINDNRHNCQGEIRIVPSFVESDHFQFYFNAANVTVLPFRQVLNSGSLLLSLSFGSPIIAPLAGSIPEIAMGDYFFGYKLSENLDREVDNLANAMRRAKNDLSQKNDMLLSRKQIIDFARNKYDWREAAKELKIWYLKLLS